MFHIHLKTRRIIRGLTQKQVANYLKIAPQSISKWEKGDSLPSIDYLPKLAECLQCDINAFFDPVSEKGIYFEIFMEYVNFIHGKMSFEDDALESIIAYESVFPSITEATLSVFQEMMVHQTANPKIVQGLLGYSETETQDFLTYLSEKHFMPPEEGEDLIMHAVTEFCLFANAAKNKFDEFPKEV